MKPDATHPWLAYLAAHHLPFTIPSPGTWVCETPRGKLMLYPRSMKVQWKDKVAIAATSEEVVRLAKEWGLIPGGEAEE